MPITPTSPTPTQPARAGLTVPASIPRGTQVSVGYTVPPEQVMSKNWVGIFVPNAALNSGSLHWQYTPDANGTVGLPNSEHLGRPAATSCGYWPTTATPPSPAPTTSPSPDPATVRARRPTGTPSHRTAAPDVPERHHQTRPYGSGVEPLTEKNGTALADGLLSAMAKTAAGQRSHLLVLDSTAPTSRPSPAARAPHSPPTITLGYDARFMPEAGSKGRGTIGGLLGERGDRCAGRNSPDSPRRR
ncbi:hypothetical protein LUR56_06715 [Streptomyces sp. MT29]|nr:hypothetical protein [Streptomyces sp. MT29]